MLLLRGARGGGGGEGKENGQVEGVAKFHDVFFTEDGNSTMNIMNDLLRDRKGPFHKYPQTTNNKYANRPFHFQKQNLQKAND